MAFTDPGAERAIVGCITAGTFSEIPQDILISPEAFHDPVRRIVYATALELGKAGQPAYIGSINALVQGNGQYRELQKALHPVAWESWSQDCDESLAHMQRAIIADCFSRIHHCYIAREAARIGSELNSGILTIPAACEALTALQANGNGQFNRKPFDDRLLDIANPPEEPIAILTLGGQNICTPGNLTTILAQAKAGKSAVVGAILGALAANCDGDFLDWHAILNLEGHAVIHFDTEQSPFDHYRIMSRALRRAQLDSPPPWLYSYRLADIPTLDRRDFLEHELTHRRKQHKGILAVLIDGVGDLAVDTNSIEESNNLVIYLHRLAIKFKCVIICVLHENPSSVKDSPAKARGHLGSELERKSESNVRLVKDGNGVTTQSTAKSRHAYITEATNLRFAFNPQLGMHVSIGPAGETPASTEERDFVSECFENVIGGLSYGECIDKLHRIERISERTAKTHFKRYLAIGLIVKNPNAKRNYLHGDG